MMRQFFKENLVEGVTFLTINFFGYNFNMMNYIAWIFSQPNTGKNSQVSFK